MIFILYLVKQRIKEYEKHLLTENNSGEITKFSSLAINSLDGSEGKSFLINDKISHIKRISDKNNNDINNKKENQYENQYENQKQNENLNENFLKGYIIETTSLNINDFFNEKIQRDKFDNDIKKFKIHNGNTYNSSLIGNLNFLIFSLIFNF
jgi:hypothetical protein